MKSPPRLHERLAEIERALAACTYRAGPWQRFVADVSRSDAATRRALAADIDRVSDALHQRRGYAPHALVTGVALEALGAVLAFALLAWGVATGSAAGLGVAAGLFALTLQPLVKLACGSALGIRHAYFYVFHGEPRFKLCFGDYLAAPPWRRALTHASGIVGVPVGLGLVWWTAGAQHSTLATILAIVISGHVGVSVALMTATALGVGRLPGLGPLRFNSAGAAGHEIHEAFARARSHTQAEDAHAKRGAD